MRHYTCDLCGMDLTENPYERHTVTIESSQAQQCKPLSEADFDVDHLESMAEMLKEMEAGQDSAKCTPKSLNHEFDLCTKCNTKFMADPLARERSRKPHFSKN